MGHYRSEMGFEDEDERRAFEKERRHNERAAYIKKDIGERGIEHVLADILSDPLLYRIRC